MPIFQLFVQLFAKKFIRMNKVFLVKKKGVSFHFLKR